jgi:hypothetical protein
MTGIWHHETFRPTLTMSVSSRRPEVVGRRPIDPLRSSIDLDQRNNAALSFFYQNK